MSRFVWHAKLCISSRNGWSGGPDFMLSTVRGIRPTPGKKRERAGRAARPARSLFFPGVGRIPRTVDSIKSGPPLHPLREEMHSLACHTKRDMKIETITGKERLRIFDRLPG